MTSFQTVAPHHALHRRRSPRASTTACQPGIFPGIPELRAGAAAPDDRHAVESAACTTPMSAAAGAWRPSARHEHRPRLHHAHGHAPQRRGRHPALLQRSRRSQLRGDGARPLHLLLPLGRSTNFAAIWLRPQWYPGRRQRPDGCPDGGLSFITSGDYSRSSAIEGVWSVLRTSLLVGNTQTGNGYSSNGGPFLNGTAQSLNCDNSTGRARRRSWPARASPRA